MGVVGGRDDGRIAAVGDMTLLNDRDGGNRAMSRLAVPKNLDHLEPDVSEEQKHILRMLLEAVGMRRGIEGRANVVTVDDVSFDHTVAVHRCTAWIEYMYRNLKGGYSQTWSVAIINRTMPMTNMICGIVRDLAVKGGEI